MIPLLVLPNFVSGSRSEMKYIPLIVNIMPSVISMVVLRLWHKTLILFVLTEYILSG